MVYRETANNSRLTRVLSPRLNRCHDKLTSKGRACSPCTPTLVVHPWLLCDRLSWGHVSDFLAKKATPRKEMTRGRVLCLGERESLL